MYLLKVFFDVVRNLTSNKNICLLELIKNRSNVHEKKISRERALNVDQFKSFSENYKPARVWVKLVYKITENLPLRL